MPQAKTYVPDPMFTKKLRSRSNREHTVELKEDNLYKIPGCPKKEKVSQQLMLT